MPVRLLVAAFYDRLWNRVDLAIASEILHPEVSFRGSVGMAAVGRSGVCDYVTMVTTALADYRCDVEELIAQGPTAAAKVRFSGSTEGTSSGIRRLVDESSGWAQHSSSKKTTCCETSGCSVILRNYGTN